MIVAAALALGTSYRGLLGRRAYGRAARLTDKAFVGLLDVQVLLGLVLYSLSPIVRTGLGDLGAAMGTKELRFFAVEHVTGMVIALVFAHVGHKRAYRAEDERAKWRAAALWQTLAAVSVAISIPWWRPLLRGW